MFRRMKTFSGIVLLLSCSSLVAQQQTSISVLGSEQASNGTWDTGSITLTINNIYTKQIQYGRFSSGAGIASALGGLLSEDPNSPVNAQAYGNTIQIRARSSQGGVLSSVSFDCRGQLSSFSATQALPATSTTVSAIPASPATGEQIQFTAQVNPGSATGTITFYDGANVIGQQSIDEGTANFSTSNLTAGTHSIRASYSGDASDASNNSAPVTITVSDSSSGMGTVHFSLQDAYTGFGVTNATLAGTPVVDQAPTSMQTYGSTEEEHTIDLSLPAGRYALEISAQGYKTMRLIEDIPGALGLVLLTPTSEPAAVTAAKASVQPGHLVVYGFVADSEHLRPVAGVKVTFVGNKFSATTDASGFYTIDLPPSAIPAPPDNNPFPFDTLQTHIDGYSDTVLQQVELYDSSMSQNLAITAGSGTDVSTLRLFSDPTYATSPSDAYVDSGIDPLPDSLEQWESGTSSANPSVGSSTKSSRPSTNY